MTIEANFDLIFLMQKMKIKYTELNIYEINTMLYLAQLLCIYDGNTSNEWGYVFTNNEYGGPFSNNISTEIEELCDNNKLIYEEGYYQIDKVEMGEIVEKLSDQYRFKWRTKYLQNAINSVMLKTLPQVVDAIQNEPGITRLQAIQRHSTLHYNTDKNLDDLYEDFAILREIAGETEDRILVSASIWIDYLASR